MLLTFGHLFPAERDGASGTYTLKEIHLALSHVGYEVSLDHINEAQRVLRERKAIEAIDVPRQRAYEFSWQAACRIARYATHGQIPDAERTEAQAIEEQHQRAAIFQANAQRDVIMLNLLRAILEELRAIKELLKEIPQIVSD